jgi:hypothetical protein
MLVLRVVGVGFGRSPRQGEVGRCQRFVEFEDAVAASAQPSDWIDVPTSDRLWATDREGDVVLATAGDGVFARE